MVWSKEKPDSHVHLKKKEIPMAFNRPTSETEAWGRGHLGTQSFSLFKNSPKCMHLGGVTALEVPVFNKDIH